MNEQKTEEKNQSGDKESKKERKKSFKKKERKRKKERQTERKTKKSSLLLQVASSPERYSGYRKERKNRRREQFTTHTHRAVLTTAATTIKQAEDATWCPQQQGRNTKCHSRGNKEARGSRTNAADQIKAAEYLLKARAILAEKKALRREFVALKWKFYDCRAYCVDRLISWNCE